MEHEELGRSIVQTVQTFMFILPIVGIIWKLATVHAQIGRHTADIENLNKHLQAMEERHNSNFETLVEKLNKLAAVYAQIERHTTDIENLNKHLQAMEGRHNSHFETLIEKLNKMEVTMVELASELKHLRRKYKEDE